jgi:diguanylate cyclase (GGDEF)-like protein
MPRLAGENDRPFNRMVDTLARRERILKELIDILADEAAENVLARKKLQKEAAVSKLHEDTLFQIASIDPLTGLANRRLLRELVCQAIADTRRGNRRFALMFVALDNFKPVNDTYGHVTGDMLLSVIAARLKRLLRESDIVARYGGDEFVVVIKAVKNDDQARVVAAKILAHIAEPGTGNGVTCGVQASIGIAMYPDHGGDMDMLLEAADAAMYNVKKTKKNGFEFA